MAAPIFQRTLVDSDGNVEIGAIVQVRNEANNELAPIFVDRALTVAKENPFITDETGMIEFFVERGEYKVRANSGDNEITWRYVQMLDTEFVASTDTAQTLTNKTINLANNTLVATSEQLRAAITDETGTGSAVFSISPALTGTPTVPTAAAGTNTTQAASTAHVFAERSNTLTLTNKTLTTPVLSATASGTTSGRLGYNSGALSYGTGSVQRTVVNTDEAQTLTNKTLTSPSITTPTGIVKADVGLGNVDNTADSEKNVATAATLTTARTINGTSFNGSANITTTNWGTARTLSFTGDVTGTSSVNGSANVATAMTLANSGVTAASYGGNNSIPSLTVDAKGRVTAASVVVPSGTWAISISGVAATATILATTRTINGVSFNGSANINVPNILATNGTTSLATTGVTSAVNYLATTNAATGGAVSLTTNGTDANIGLNITTKGDGAIVIDTGLGAGQIDLKPGASNARLWDDDSSHYYQFVTGNRTANYNITLPAGNVTLTAGTSVVTTRSLTAGDGLSGGGDLSANRTFAVDATVVRTSGAQTIADAKTFSSIIGGSIDGNAATATALQTARTIGGVSFNGTANINLPGVNTAGNQNTTGTAANVTGTVAVANGGTGRTSLTTGNVVLGAGTSAVNFVPPTTVGNVLTANGTTWVSAPPPASGGGVTVSATAPISPSDGDLWYDTANSALKIWITSSWRGTATYT
jgi:hypothetical protein